MSLQLALLCIGAYILGSIPFGYLVARAKGIDITKVGSGNIGATNVHRALGWKMGIPVLLLDIAKGLIPPLLARYGYGMDTDHAMLTGIAAVLGHCFSPFLRFKGGKGIATMLGATLGSTPIVAGIGLAAFGIFFALTRYVSLASLVAVVAAFASAALLRYPPLVVGAYAAIGLFIIYKHRANIGRLLRGEEPRTSFRGGEKRLEKDDEEETK